MRGRAVAPDDLDGRLAIRDGAGRLPIVGDDGLPEARRLGDAHGPRDDGVEHLLREVLAHLFGDLLREAGAAVVHRQQDRGEAQPRVEVLLDHPHGAEQLAEALERVVLALDRDEQLAARP